jgi:wyosine [tRNA(Phe)-imidazoG37] synthetase (radical SAM superfamily)
VKKPDKTIQVLPVRRSQAGWQTPYTHCVFGPVPSRRLGRSLGVDIVPFKTCTCDGIYYSVVWGDNTGQPTDEKPANQR